MICSVNTMMLSLVNLKGRITPLEYLCKSDIKEYQAMQNRRNEAYLFCLGKAMMAPIFSQLEILLMKCSGNS